MVQTDGHTVKKKTQGLSLSFSVNIILILNASLRSRGAEHSYLMQIVEI